MGQFGFFDTNNRLEALSAKGDTLEAIDAIVPWESFRETIEAVVLTPAAAKKSNAGRKPIDAIVMFRMLILQSLYNLSDDQVEYQVRDRFSFTRFLKLGIEDRIPDGTTLWLVRGEAGESRADREVVRAIRSASGGQGLYRARGADSRRDDRAGAQAAQHARGERGGQGRPNTRGMGAEAREK